MSMKRYSRQVLWIALVVLVIASAAGPAYLISHPSSTGQLNHDQSAGPIEQPRGGRGVVCYGYVDVEQGIASLSPLQPGRVAEVLVAETEEVAAGKVLLRLEDRQAKLRVEEAKAALASAQTQQELARQLPEQHRARLAQQKESIEAARRRRSSSQHSLIRKQQLLKAQQISVEELAAAEEQIKEIEALERAAVQKLAELQVTDPAVEQARADAEVATYQARLAQAQQVWDECVLKAPGPGTVMRILVGPGDVIGTQPGKAALLFCPSKPRLIRAEVEQEFATRLAVGQSAIVEDDTAAGATWRGRVYRVSDWYTQRRAVFQESPLQNDVRTVECLIALESSQPPLRIGQRVRVAINRELP